MSARSPEEVQARLVEAVRAQALREGLAETVGCEKADWTVAIGPAGPWIAVHAVSWTLARRSLQREAAAAAEATKMRWPRLRRLSLALSMLGAVVPMVTLCFFLIVFVFGHSSNVAQLAGESGRELRALWLDVWPLLFFTSPLSLAIAVASVLLPPYSPRKWQHWVARVCAIFVSALSCYVVLTFFPDA